MLDQPLRSTESNDGAVVGDDVQSDGLSAQEREMLAQLQAKAAAGGRGRGRRGRGRGR